MQLKRCTKIGQAANTEARLPIAANESVWARIGLH